MAYGLRPVGRGAAGYNTSGATAYKIADGETDNMFTGALMLQEASGYVTALALTPTGATALLSTVGVAIGFQYVDADGVPRWSQQYVGNAGNTDAYAYIVDDPEARFLIQSDGLTAQADVGLNAPVVSSTGTPTAINQGNTFSGLSTNVLDFSAQAVTATLALRILGIPEDGTNETSATPNVLVKINPACHQLLNATGL